MMGATLIRNTAGKRQEEAIWRVARDGVMTANAALRSSYMMIML